MTPEYLRSILHYAPGTGEWTRLHRADREQRWNTRCAGKSAVLHGAGGYVMITVDNKKYYGHRLAFLYMAGEIPSYIDHIDGDPGNCRWSNLRPATRSENMGNARRSKRNKSGFKGVHWEQGKWCARIMSGRKKHFLGYFEDPATAHKAYCAAAQKMFGEFANPGERMPALQFVQ